MINLIDEIITSMLKDSRRDSEDNFSSNNSIDNKLGCRFHMIYMSKEEIKKSISQKSIKIIHTYLEVVQSLIIRNASS